MRVAQISVCRLWGKDDHKVALSATYNSISFDEKLMKVYSSHGCLHSCNVHKGRGPIQYLHSLVESWQKFIYEERWVVQNK